MNNDFNDLNTPTSTPAEPTPAVDHTPLLRHLAKDAYSRMGWMFLLLMIGWYAITFIVQLVAAFVAPDLLNDYTFLSLSGTLPLYLVCTPLLYLGLKNIPLSLPLETAPLPAEKKKLTLAAFFILILMSESLMVAGSYIGNGLMSLMSALVGYDYSNPLDQAFEMPIWVSFILTVILAPIFEELIFRKLLLDRMIPHGEVAAVVLNGLLFGLFHGNFFQFFYAAALGMLLAYIYVRTRRVWYTILLHMIINFIGGIVPTLLYEWMDYDTYLALFESGDEEALAQHISDHILPYLGISAYGLFQFGAALAGLILFIVYRKNFIFVKQQDQLAPKAAIKTALGNAGMVMALIVLILMTLSALIPVVEA